MYKVQRDKRQDFRTKSKELGMNDRVGLIFQLDWI